MVVVSNVAFRDGLYIPFFQQVRGGADGKSPVGTVHSTNTATGDVSGGAINLRHQLSRLSFGFRALIAPTLIVTIDNLASPEVVNLNFVQEANRRTSIDMVQAALAVAGQQGNAAKFEESGILLEHDNIGLGDSVALIWSTNTDGKVYISNVFAAVFDAELIEANGSVSDFLAGVR